MSGAIILVLKGNLAIVESKNPLVGDGNPVRVAAKVFEDLFGTAKGRLGVNNPIDVLERFYQQVKSGGIFEGGDDSGKLELLVAKSQLERFD